MTTDELHAYNAGRWAHDQGLELAGLVSHDLEPVLRPGEPGDFRAWQRLGRAGYGQWTVRGWFDRSREAVG